MLKFKFVISCESELKAYQGSVTRDVGHKRNEEMIAMAWEKVLTFSPLAFHAVG